MEKAESVEQSRRLLDETPTTSPLASGYGKSPQVGGSRSGPSTSSAAFSTAARRYSPQPGVSHLAQIVAQASYAASRARTKTTSSGGSSALSSLYGKQHASSSGKSAQSPQQFPIISTSSSFESAQQQQKEQFMSRKLTMRERLKEIEHKQSGKRKGKAPPSIFEAASVIGKIHTNRIDLISANIQNEFGICGWILTILSYLLIFFTLPISACMCIKVVQEYERAVIFRLGRLMPGGAKGPGIFFIVPCIDTYRKVDLRVLSFEVPPQEILSKDSVTVAVDAVVYFRISNATISVTNVEDAARSTKLLAQTTLRNILGTKTLAEMLSDREAISHQMQSTLDEATEPWGVKVERVEVKDVRLPVQLQRAMAAEAEAAREARAKVIVAEGEQKASRALKEAAEVIAESPSAIQLRYLQTLNSISAEKNSTIIFPFPIDLLSAFLSRPVPKIDTPLSATIQPHSSKIHSS